MSKVSIEIDTEAETVSVSVDGTAIGNVRSLNAYFPDPDDSYSGMGFSVNVNTSEEVGDLTKYASFTCCDGKLQKTVSEADPDISVLFEHYNRKKR